MSSKNVPNRSEIPASDKWDLTSLFKTEQDWEKALASIEPMTEEVASYKGKLAASKEILLEALNKYSKLCQILEIVYNYASLQHNADEGDQSALNKLGRAEMAASKLNSTLSFFDSEITAIDDSKLNLWIETPEFSDYKVFIKKLLHVKPYILSEKEERILALQAEAAETPYKTFSILENLELDFGTIEVEGKQIPLTQSSWSQFLKNPDRNVRKEAYEKFYNVFEKHENTLASLYAGSVNQDIFETRSRGYKSSLDRALYSNKVPIEVYHNLIDTVHKNFDTLHRYYKVFKKALGTKDLRHYDVYMPFTKDIAIHTSYDEAVEICRKALSPLGKEYTDTLCSGLKNGWVDRYENKGKRSGAFSSGCFTGYPYILLNYKEDVIRDVFTMAHEGGHSMHSWYSSHNNPFMCYDYTIFEAEVASTFNEELVFKYLLKNAKSKEERKYYLSMRAGDILATLHRQTMFAEYELKAHELVENGTPLSAEVLRKLYRELLEQYFGSEMVFEKNSDMEGLRIPHFYSAFYVYKYATGISAAMALADRVTNGGEAEREDYFKFLKSGGSRYPIESLKLAGVDMSKTEPIQKALDKFKEIVDELENLV
ncbi:MAG: oligoendopeptidase F [Treponema sp.]|uniref:oligoendopeptidase F n=1 Tax=Treponema sp. TaxID=166 RepID=UPI001B6D72F1|nr:oligoendopeptidase F [Treponema sp.]MBP5402734.1 oligoendopeptidase F [Treponema sp.]MBR5934077.1 oligoendopeptidase F [Treponema sp.]